MDLKTEVILGAEVYAADQADTATLVPGLEQAQAHVDATESGRTIEKAAADKGYHAADTLVACRELDLLGVKTYIPPNRLCGVAGPTRQKNKKRPCSAIEPALSGPTENDCSATANDNPPH